MEKINTQIPSNPALSDTQQTANPEGVKGKVLRMLEFSKKERVPGTIKDCQYKPGRDYSEDMSSIIGEKDFDFPGKADSMAEIAKYFSDIAKEALELAREVVNNACRGHGEPEIDETGTEIESPADTSDDIEVETGTEVSTDLDVETKDTKGSTATNLQKTGEFLWKPQSDKDGKLAILLPGKLTGKVKKVRIIDADGNVLAKGKYAGTGNGISKNEREHYRFDKAGSKFPDGVTVEITLKNGNTKKVKIKETSERKVH